MKIPQSILFSGSQTPTSDLHYVKTTTKSQFRTKVVLTDDYITVEGEGAPSVVGLFKGNSQESSSMKRYECNLADLPVIILQQVCHIVHTKHILVSCSINEAEDLLVFICIHANTNKCIFSLSYLYSRITKMILDL